MSSSDTATCSAAPPRPDPESAQLPLGDPLEDHSALCGGEPSDLTEGLGSPPAVDRCQDPGAVEPDDGRLEVTVEASASARQPVQSGSTMLCASPVLHVR